MSGEFSDRNPPPSNRQLLTLAGLFVGVIVLIIWLVSAIANGLVWLIPPSVEQQIGKPFIAAYEQIAENASAQRKLNDLLDELEAELPAENRAERDYQLLYVTESIVNALALPGDTIVLYQGLVAQAESENELMMVLGHELGHFANRDHLRKLGRSFLLRGALAVIFGDGGWIESVLSSSINRISSAQFSQSQERQADEFGLQLLVAYYGHAAGATDFFDRMADKDRRDFAFLSTHPRPDRRVQELEKLIQQRGYKIEARSPLPEVL